MEERKENSCFWKAKKKDDSKGNTYVEASLGCGFYKNHRVRFYEQEMQMIAEGSECPYCKKTLYIAYD